MAATVNGHEYTFTDFVGTGGKDYSRTNTDTCETQFPDSVIRDMVARVYNDVVHVPNQILYAEYCAALGLEPPSNE